ncbi:hypothetical protein SVAN01_05250 [Stagonosporopsis vannaccii]|nr:hypothetical protein SVAN01_05250 [Stagonosporopsis vannaccii]
MLRREPTVIGLTQADIDQYDANRKHKLLERQQQQAKAAQSAQSAESTQSSQGSEKTQSAQPEPQKSTQDRVMGGR